MVTTRSGSRRVPIAELMTPPNVGRAILFGGFAAVVGALAWGAVVYFFHLELGILAWAIGGLVGFACVLGRGYGTPVAITAGGLALLSILFGKMFAFRMIVEEELNQQFTVELHGELKTDAEAWAALGADPSDDAIGRFILDRDYDYDDVSSFRQDVVPWLVEFGATQPTFEEWRAEIVAEVADEESFIDYLQRDFHPLDLLFAGLGIATAFGLVERRTSELRVEARQAAREGRSAEPEES